MASVYTPAPQHPTPVTLTNASGHLLLLTAPTVASEVGRPTDVCFTDHSGNEYLVTGDTVGVEDSSPIPVVLCNQAGDILVPPFIITSGSNAVTVTSTLTGTKLGQPEPVYATDVNGVPLTITGAVVGAYDTTPTPILLSAPSGQALTITIS